MIDLTSLTNIFVIASSTIGGITGFWKVFIAPGRKFRTSINGKLADIETRLKGLETGAEKFQESLQAEIDGTDKDFKRDIDDIKKDQKNLEQSLKDHIEKVDAKNDKLLDLIIKYFTEKSD